MTRGGLGLFAVFAVASAIVALKAVAPAKPSSGNPRKATAIGGGPSVLLFADPGEAADSCGCGQIIRLVRAAGGRGVSVREVAPNGDPLLLKRYRVTVAPTVLLLDASGGVTARYEGEAPETIAAIRGALDRLARSGP
ncbi:MAG: hypothetical protein ACYCWW_11550 [Deltaproteobacteria bacterium]